MTQKKKVVLAAGGTGGHMFPAQILAEELQTGSGLEVFFAGWGLKKNRYFKRERYPYEEISSATLFAGNRLSSLFTLYKGIKESLVLLHREKPDLVVGFGSFHSFPILCAAFLKRIPFVLFEPNAIPGRVNRFLSFLAKASYIQFPKAAHRLRGVSSLVKMPTAEKKRIDRAVAREYFYLSHHLLTLLVFGGSQGAESINTLVKEATQTLGKEVPFQVIHITGSSESAVRMRAHYERLGIRSCVKVFEEKMEFAWSSADLVICRAGAATIAEQVAFGIPAIFIPFPKATENHQYYNASFIEQEVKGAKICLEEESFRFSSLLKEMMQEENLRRFQEAIASFKQEETKPSLSEAILRELGKEG